MGINDEEVFVSKAYCIPWLNGLYRKKHLQWIYPGILSEMLVEHLTWKKEGRFKSIFISTTSSLLFALQHAIRKKWFEKNVFGATTIKIAVIDGRKLQSRGRTYAATELVEYAGLGSTKRFNHEWFASEYLTWGKIDSDAIVKVVVARDLLKLGLVTNLLPELAERGLAQQSLLKRINYLRWNCWFPPGQRYFEWRRGEIDDAIEIGWAFGRKLALPIAVMLLALKRRGDSNDEVDYFVRQLTSEFRRES